MLCRHWKGATWTAVSSHNESPPPAYTRLGPRSSASQVARLGPDELRLRTLSGLAHLKDGADLYDRDAALGEDGDGERRLQARQRLEFLMRRRRGTF